MIVGHYGAGKTNFAVNVAVDLAGEGCQVAVVDLDVVNPYFRASEQRKVLEEHGVRLIAPVFSEAGTSLDVPSLTGAIAPAIQSVSDDAYVIIDAGGDDVGATALGRFATLIKQREYAMLYVANRFRNLVQNPADALENLREIEMASHLQATAIANNSHLKEATTAETIEMGRAYATELSAIMNLPIACTTIPKNIDTPSFEGKYEIAALVRTPWE